MGAIMRYFYTDALKAAWMLREFKIGYEGFLDKNSRWCQISDFTKDGKWYIHPDCYEILKPQAGDVGVSGSKALCTYSSATKKWVDMGCFTYRKVRIIERNGLAFFTPEQEQN